VSIEHKGINDTSSGKTWLMEGPKEQALIRRRPLCAASNQSFDFLSHISICTTYFSGFLYNLKVIYMYVYKNMEKG